MARKTTDRYGMPAGKNEATTRFKLTDKADAASKAAKTPAGHQAAANAFDRAVRHHEKNRTGMTREVGRLKALADAHRHQGSKAASGAKSSRGAAPKGAGRTGAKGSASAGGGG